MAPEISGRVVELRVRDNEFVHKGDLLMVIDPADYAIAVSSTTGTSRKLKPTCRTSVFKPNDAWR